MTNDMQKGPTYTSLNGVLFISEEETFLVWGKYGSALLGLILDSNPRKIKNVDVTLPNCQLYSWKLKAQS